MPNNLSQINLLPPEDRNAKVSSRYILLIAGSVLYLVSLAGFYGLTHFRVNKLALENSALENQIKMTQPVLNRISELEKEQKGLTAKLASSRSLQDELYFSQLMVYISKLTPAKITLRRLTCTSNNIAFEGTSVDYGSIAELMLKLKSSKYFLDVQLLSSAASGSSGNVITFKIMTKLNLKG